ncbi:MAG: pteridine-dependent deoxygenase [Steroidobacteraceae bacterium]|nr:pteridine-dependent deoxygenase [Steroidobacteraceae bacterium]
MSPWGRVIPAPFLCANDCGPGGYDPTRQMNPVLVTNARLASASPRFSYRRLAPAQDLPADVLLAIGFGDGVTTGERRVRVALEPLSGAGLTELWMANGPVTCGEFAGVRFSSDEHFLAGVLEVHESEHGGLAQAAAAAYRTLARFQSESRFPHLLRTWNYFDAINEGAGDAERYRNFCTGRVAGLAQWRQLQHPAATVIGGREDRRVLQLYWLAGREPGLALENPRQVSAYLYPRQYGETAPTFSRAMLVTPGLLMISGTASIVGHASRHLDDTREQAREILANLDSLLARAHSQAPALPVTLGRDTLIKAYLRNRADLPVVEAALRERLPPDTPLLLLQGDVCRAELLVELDCVAYSGG